MNSRSPLGAGRELAMVARIVQTAWHSSTLIALVCLLLAARVTGAGASAPVLISWKQLDPSNLGQPVAARNGDTVRITTVWDQDSLAVTADCRELSSGPVTVLPTSSREFLIIHQIPATNDRGDGIARIEVTAVNAAGDSTVENSPGVCISNRPPRLVRSLVFHPRPFAYSRGDTIEIASRWDSWDPALFVQADFRAIQPSFTFEDAAEVVMDGVNFGDSLGTSYHLISFVIPFRPVADDTPDGHGPDGRGLVIPLSATDGGCGLAQDVSIRVDFDTTPPQDLPEVDPLAAETAADSVQVSGRAVGAVRVSVWRNESQQFTVPVDSVTNRFEARLKLVSDRPNKIYVKAEDGPGNPTLPSNVQFVTQVRSPGFAIPRPYRRSQAVVFRQPGGASDLEIRLFDLEGSCLRVWKADTFVRDFRFEWDGLDAQGARAGQGMYLMRAAWRDADGGRAHAETAGVFLRD